MRKVQFPLEMDGSRIIYPDDISNFFGATIEDSKMVAEYTGDLPLDDYVPPEPARIELTHLEFRRLFTLQERIAFDNFEENPALAPEHKQTLRTLMKDMELAQVLDLKDPDLIAGVSAIQAFGIIAPGRAAEVLAYRP